MAPRMCAINQSTQQEVMLSQVLCLSSDLVVARRLNGRDAGINSYAATCDRQVYLWLHGDLPQAP